MATKIMGLVVYNVAIASLIITLEGKR